MTEFLDRAAQLRDQFAPQMQLITRSACNPEPAEHRQRWRDLLESKGLTPEFRRWMAPPDALVNMTGRTIVVPAGVCGFMQEASEFKEHPWSGQINLLYVDADGTVVQCC